MLKNLNMTFPKWFYAAIFCSNNYFDDVYIEMKFGMFYEMKRTASN